MLVRRAAARLAAARRLASSHGACVVGSRLDDVTLPDVTLPELVWRDMDRWRDHPAIVCGLTGRGYTYTELRTGCARIGAALRGEGLQRGDVVCVALANAPDFPLALLGALEAGLVVSTLNPASTPSEMALQLRDCSPRCVVCSEENQGAVRAALDLCDLRNALLVVAPALDEPDRLAAGAVLLRTLLCAAGDDVIAPAPSGGEAGGQVAVIPYSSGTTGLPKGVCLSHGNLVANVAQVRATAAFRRMRVPGDGNSGEVVPAVLPFYHIYGLNSVMVCTLAAGSQLVTLPRFTQPALLRMLDNHAATMLFLVPPLVLWMAQCDDVTTRHLDTAWLVASGAAPLAASDVTRFMKKAPPTLQFIQGYGLTETSPCVFSLEMGSHKLASVGGPLPNTLAKVVDPDGAALGPGLVGEVCCQGPQNMLGYHNNPVATAEMVDPEGWLHTGDLGYYDADGDFFIVDRLKELIKVKGLQVAPAELEALLRSHPSVEDAAVVGVADARAGELPTAFIVPAAGADVSTLGPTLQAFVAARLSPHKHLTGGVRFIDLVPKSPAGKILRKELRKTLSAT